MLLARFVARSFNDCRYLLASNIREGSHSKESCHGGLVEVVNWHDATLDLRLGDLPRWSCGRPDPFE